MKIDLTGKRAVVSGSTAGIGLAIATGLAQAGAEVVVNGRTEERVQSAIATIRAAVPTAILSGVASDLGTHEGAAKLAAGAAEADILVNSVGAALFKSFDDLTEEDWLFMYQLNVMSGVRLTKHYLPGMMEAGLGPHRLHQQRIGAQSAQGDDRLRDDQGRPACPFARRRRTGG